MSFSTNVFAPTFTSLHMLILSIIVDMLSLDTSLRTESYEAMIKLANIVKEKQQVDSW